MIHKKYAEPMKITKYTGWITIFIAVLGLNYWYLNRYLSSNTSYVTDFTPQEDVLSEYRQPLVAGMFYSVVATPAKTEDREETAGYFESKGTYRPKILILPTTEQAYSSGKIDRVYSLLNRYAASIGNVFLLKSIANSSESAIYLMNKQSTTTPVGDLIINQKIVAELAETGVPFVVDDRKFSQEKSLELQYPYIKKALPKARIIPMLASGDVTSKLTEILQTQIYLAQNLLIITEDLIPYHGKKTERQETNNVDIALQLAKILNYHPQMFQLNANTPETGKFFDDWDFYTAYEKESNKGRLERETQNLSSFVSLYKEHLIHIAQTALDKATHNGREYSPSKRSFPEDIFDKGATYIILHKNGAPRGLSGSILPISSVAQNIADNTYRAATGENGFPKLTPEELSEIEITIYLLSNFEKISYENERDLLNKINSNLDGLVIRDGNRQGVSMPYEWKETQDVTSFFKKLKIKAGMNPNYWNNRINVYRFRTVEIKNEN